MSFHSLSYFFQSFNFLSSFPRMFIYSCSVSTSLLFLFPVRGFSSWSSLPLGLRLTLFFSFLSFLSCYGIFFQAAAFFLLCFHATTSFVFSFSLLFYATTIIFLSLVWRSEARGGVGRGRPQVDGVAGLINTIGGAAVGQVVQWWW